MQAPFTVDADIDLGARAARWLRDSGADVVVRRGPVPAILPNPSWRNVACQYAEDRVLITAPCGVRFLVEGGESIRWAVDEGRRATEVDVRTFLIGSAWPVLALQRGLLPLHASAVIRGGIVHGFTAEAGAGKSTMAAGLAGRGWSFFADDMLLVAPAPAGQEILCHSLGDLKLARKGLAMAGAVALGPVRSLDSEVRMYAEPRQCSSSIGGRLSTLHILQRGHQRGDPIRIERLAGRRAAEYMWRAVYGRELAQEIMGERWLYQNIGAAIRQVEMSVLRLSMSDSGFDDVLERLAQDLRGAEAVDVQ